MRSLSGGGAVHEDEAGEPRRITLHRERPLWEFVVGRASLDLATLGLKVAPDLQIVSME